jgi:hypothetical protein
MGAGALLFQKYQDGRAQLQNERLIATSRRRGQTELRFAQMLEKMHLRTQHK